MVNTSRFWIGRCCVCRGHWIVTPSWYFPLDTASIRLFLSWRFCNKPWSWSENQGCNHKCQKHGWLLSKTLFHSKAHSYNYLIARADLHPMGNCSNSWTPVDLDFMGKTKISFMEKTSACLLEVHHHIIGHFLNYG